MRVPKDTAINTLLASRKPLLPATPPSNFLPMDPFSGYQAEERARPIDRSIDEGVQLSAYLRAEILQASEGPALSQPTAQFIYVYI